MSSPRRSLPLLLAATFLLTSALARARQDESPAAAAEVDFERDVLPVLRARCFECHGPLAERGKGGLKMDGQPTLLEGGYTGPAIVPGDADASLLVQAIRYGDPDYEMPPKTKLPDEEIALLERWVAGGAHWPAELTGARAAGPPPPTATELAARRYFEDEIRPLFAEHCFRCHGPELDEVESGLRMSGHSALLAGGDRGPAVVPGKPDESLLVRAVRYEDSKLAMPPDGKLRAHEVELIERWVASGAVWPDADALPARYEAPTVDLAGGRERWSYRPVERPEVPAVRDGAALENPVDAFVLARLEAAGLEPSPTASERELVRRVTLDLIGLPPTFEEVEAYLADPAPDKWPRLIDRLLASPRYGERWGRRWLDVVRFAQTNGYERDTEKPYAWRYRDWVIDAFNRDLPFDQFLAQQLAGDELEDAELAGSGRGAIVGTGFYHLGAWDSEPDDKEQAVLDGQDDVLRAIGEGMLGLTIGCARCHDHKFDPVRQEDYYGLLAFVQNVKPYTKPSFSHESDILAPLEFTPALAEQWERDRQARLAELDGERRELLDAARARLVAEIVAQQPPEVGAAYHTPAAERTREQKRLLSTLTHLAPGAADVQAALTDREKQEAFLLMERAQQVATSSFEGNLPWALVAREHGPEPAPTFLLGRGLASAPLGEVAPTFVPVLCASDEASMAAVPPAPADAETSGRRRALAEWITSPEHPTTARVIANRVWQGHFGRGIVRTPNDFGVMGLPPTHPALLDWLASELVQSGWSLKALHRLILGSATYRMSSRVSDARALERDPANDLFWRQNLRRVDAETLHDSMLAVSGQLALGMGGRGYFPGLSREALAGASKPGDGWELSPLQQRNRRAVYGFVKRGMISPMLAVFDFADPTLPTGARPTTTIASQALTLLNGEFASRNARALSQHVRAEAGADPDAQVTRLYERALARRPQPEELALARAWLERASAELALLPPAIELRPALPSRLQTDFLKALPDKLLFDGARAGWTPHRGRWGGYYNDTFEREPGRGPFVLLDEPELQDGALRARVTLSPASEITSLVLRGRALEGELIGVELSLDPQAQELRLVALAEPGAEPEVLGVAPLELEPGRPLALELAVDGARVTARVDGRELLSSDACPVTTPGRAGLRTWGDTLRVEDMTLILDEGAFAVPPDDLGPPRQRALELLCLSVLNLNEFVYVD